MLRLLVNRDDVNPNALHTTSMLLQLAAKANKEDLIIEVLLTDV